jgi:hypothetical protein
MGYGPLHLDAKPSTRFAPQVTGLDDNRLEARASDSGWRTALPWEIGLKNKFSGLTYFLIYIQVLGTTCIPDQHHAFVLGTLERAVPASAILIAAGWEQVRSNVFPDRIFWLLRMGGATRPRFRVRKIEHRHEAAEPNQIKARFLRPPICRTKCVNALRLDNHLVDD